MATALKSESKYFLKEIGLLATPFSNSPDPFFYYPFPAHQKILNQLEISIRLKRGACVVLGEIGTGKTTLCRSLIQRMSDIQDISFYLLLNPLCESEDSFLRQLANIMHVESLNSDNIFSSFQNHLFEQGVQNNKNVVLFIDEGQKLSLNAIESLRALLNYETNAEKLIQIIIFGQPELKSKLLQMSNFVDRISYRAMLEPLTFEESLEMIVFRLKKAGYRKKNILFTEDALEMIYQYSHGYPRKICVICHKAIERAVMFRFFPVKAHHIVEIMNEELQTLWAT